MAHKHYKLFKPYGYISQISSNDERQLRKKKFLKDIETIPKDVMPIGRLDEKSEGLLLLTTDGKLSNTVNTSGIEKEYYVLVDGAITHDQVQKLREGVSIGLNGKKYITKPCQVTLLETSPELPDRGKKIRDERHGPTTWLSIIITEGKFRQIRKMTSAVGTPTLRLVRVRIGNILLKNLLPGEVIAIEKDNISSNF
ncbi:23S rRNA pseudouridine2457 synthase [Pustulibacterium marinum]|uniref:Pseudouridine synthase n=1 Tax=Pustulibacterium marinum TaxID=1224947 RepID=A0A1I7H7F3_9FLAO|nr:pseudouridine synthase [Pustulibacterium marinum]SFU56638.1 23S rRNA pseudouridine2457 synthase [Pustulibacterium marinum]